MKIAVCISGSFRNSFETVLQNLTKLQDAGYQLDIFLVIQSESSVLKVDWEKRRLPLIGFWRPWVDYFDFSTSQTEMVKEYAESNFWHIRENNITFNELLDSYGIREYYQEVQEIASEFVNRGRFKKIKFPNHFKNSLMMLHGIKVAYSMYSDSDSSADIILRLRPDFQLSDNFVRELAHLKNVVMPIRSSGCFWDYGWGYASDMVFAGRSPEMAKLSSAINFVSDFWGNGRVVIHERKTLPFIYGDAIFSFLLDKFQIPITAVADGGDLVRPNTIRITIGSSKYSKMRKELREHHAYLEKWKEWQNLVTE